MKDIREYIDLDDSSPTGIRWIKSPTRSVKVGDVAMACPHSAGYWHGRFCGKDMYAHRVVWFLHYGEWPSECIDHINGVRTDNRVDNLRSVSRRVNIKNSKRRSDNTTGVTGVSYDKRRCRYVASLRVNGVDLSLGRYKTIEEAAAAVKAARKMDKEYSSRHGEDGIQYVTTGQRANRKV